VGDDAGEPLNGVLTVHGADAVDHHSVAILKIHSLHDIKILSLMNWGLVNELVNEALNTFPGVGMPFLTQNTFLPLVDVFR